VELRVEIHGELPALRGDASQIQQLVMDLVVNGAEAIGADRTGQVTISAGELDIGDGDVLPKPEVGEVHRGRYLLLRVQDNGEGIDEAILHRIFDPFFSTKFTGRGLGLAAAAGIVRSQRGAILVSATRGHGATFSVMFPVEADRAAAGGNPDAEERGALPGRPR
jgi:signal transduction histidine kinase